MASRIILDPETLLAQAGEMQSLTAEYESLFSKVTGTLNDTNNNWSELLAHNFAGKISSAQQSFASITELLASGAAAAKNSATTMQSVDQSLFKVFGGEAGEGIISGQVQGMTDVIEDYRKWEKKSKKVKAKSKKKKDGFLDSLKADMAGVSKAIVKKGGETGEILFGDEKLGEKMGSWAYTGLDVVSFLNGVDKLGKSFGKLQTITSGTAETSKVWGEIHMDDVIDNDLKYLSKDGIIKTILHIDPNSVANFGYDVVTGTIKSIKSAGKLGNTIADLAVG